MKKLFLPIALSLIMVYPATSQGLLNKVKSSVTRELSANPDAGATQKASKPAPEPSCACNDAVQVIDLGKFMIDYKEISISMKDDGSMLIKDKVSGKFYVVKSGTTEGPYEGEDPRVKGFDAVNTGDDDDGNKADGWIKKYPANISRSGEKYLIKFNGKSYGPYALINDFAVSKSKDKFAAIVTENLAFTENQAKSLEEQMNNAKTDQEKMQIAMKLSQQMQNQMMSNGGPETLQAKMVSNVPGAVYDPMKGALTRLNAKAKFDEILMVSPDKIYDLKGNLVLSLSQNSYSLENLFVNSSNTRYATYNSGTLMFSDNKMMSDLFNPYLIKTGGKVFLAYMYYSPGKNAIMQCSLPF